MLGVKQYERNVRGHPTMGMYRVSSVFRHVTERCCMRWSDVTLNNVLAMARDLEHATDLEPLKRPPEQINCGYRCAAR